MRMRRDGIAVLAVACLVLGCAGTRGSGRPGAGAGKPEIAIKRGAAWATYAIDPPRIVGPTAELQFSDGNLRGLIGSRALNVTIRDAGADGLGPSGPVNLTVDNGNGETKVDGLWNGAPVHFVFAPNLVKGSVAVRSGRTGADERSCSYQLDQVDKNGALVGYSTCSGLPQLTRLEIDAPVARLLKPNQLAVFLVAAFASPPLG
jgi:hypothetical protein